MADADMVAAKTESPEPPRDRSSSAKRPAIAPPAASDELAGFLPTGLTSQDIEAKLAKVAADLETEIGKRRDLRDELERQTERLQETRQQARNNSSSTYEVDRPQGRET